MPGTLRLLAFAAFALAPFVAGCSDEACFQITRAELDMPQFGGQCPPQADAIQFFVGGQNTCSDITSIDSGPSRDEKNGLCCYSVTKRDQQFCAFEGMNDRQAPKRASAATSLARASSRVPCGDAYASVSSPSSK